jgi:undecaprenyl pyrophosphate phosphatase UppP
MKLVKQLVIWIIVMTVISVVGVVAFHIVQDKMVKEMPMIMAAINGVVMGFAIGLVRYLKQRRAGSAKSRQSA